MGPYRSANIDVSVDANGGAVRLHPASRGVNWDGYNVFQGAERGHLHRPDTGEEVETNPSELVDETATSRQLTATEP